MSRPWQNCPRQKWSGRSRGRFNNRRPNNRESQNWNTYGNERHRNNDDERDDSTSWRSPHADSDDSNNGDTQLRETRRFNNRRPNNQGSQNWDAYGNEQHRNNDYERDDSTSWRSPHADTGDWNNAGNQLRETGRFNNRRPNNQRSQNWNAYGNEQHRNNDYKRDDSKSQRSPSPVNEDWSNIDTQPSFKRYQYIPQRERNYRKYTKNEKRVRNNKKLYNNTDSGDVSDGESIKSAHNSYSTKASDDDNPDDSSNSRVKFPTNSVSGIEDKLNKAHSMNADLKNLLKSMDPTDVIKKYRKDINEFVEKCLSSHEKSLQKISRQVKCSEDESKQKKIWVEHQEVLKKQLKTFDQYIANIRSTLADMHGQPLETIINDCNQIFENVKKEAKVFERALPIYAFKEEIVSSVRSETVTIISADCCYYASAVIPMFLQSICHNGIIVSCQPNVAMCISLYQNCISFMHTRGSSSVVSFEITDNNDKSDDMKILFTTVKELFSFTLNDSNLTPYSCIIVNCALRRSAEVDFLLEVLRRSVVSRDDMKLVVVVQPPQEINMFKDYFSCVTKVGTLCLHNLNLSVSIVWKTGLYKEDYIHEIVKTALAIHALEESGDVLIFLPSATDFERVSVLLSAELHRHDYYDAECASIYEDAASQTILHANQYKSSKRKFILTTSWAEQLVFPTVSYVIDPGLARDSFYDDKNCVEVERLTFISKIKAKVRKICAGRLRNGKCYRLYNRQNYACEMKPCEVADVLKQNPFDILVKMFQYGLENVMEVQFVETIPRDVKKNALDMLHNANAVKDKQLTVLGQRIIKLPFLPKFSKLIVLGVERGFAFETVVLAAIFLVKEPIFVEGEDKEEQKKTEASKLQFLVCDSDTFTFLNVYRSWMSNNYHESWCQDHALNFGTLQKIKNKVQDILNIVTQNLKEIIVTEIRSEVEMDCEALQEIIFDCFRDNLCLYTGHFRSGYNLPKAKSMTFIHPESALLLRKELPQFVVFSELQSSSRNFMVNITAIPESVVVEEAKRGTLHVKPLDLFKTKLEPFVIEPVGIMVIKNVLLGNGGRNLYDIERKIKKEINSNFIVIEPAEEKGSVTVYTLPENKEKVQTIMKELLQKKKENLLNEEETLPLELKKGHLNIFVDVTWAKGALTTNLEAHHGDSKGIISSDDSNVSSQDKYSVSCSIELSWLRRLCRGSGFLSFSNKDFSVARRLSMKTIMVRGNEADVQVNKKVQNQLYVSNLSAETSEKDIKEAVERACPGIKVIKSTIVRDQEFKTSKKDTVVMKGKLENLLSDSFPSSDFHVVVLKPKDCEIQMRAYLNFLDVVDVDKRMDIFRDFRLGEVTVTAKPIYRCAIFCSNDVLQALHKRLEEEIEHLQENLSRGTAVSQSDTSAFQLTEEPKDYNTVCLNLHSNNLKNIHLLHRTINKLLEGEVVDNNMVKGLPKLFTHGGHLWLGSLSRQQNIHILEEYKSKTLRLYGSSDDCKRAVERIHEFMADLENEAVKSVDLSHNKSARALLKTVIRTYRFDLKEFISQFQLRSAEIDVRKSELILHGSPDSINRALTALEELAISCDHVDELLQNQEECPICAMPPLQLSVRLEHCGHLYCIECLQGLIGNSKFPIQCCFEACDKELILEDLRRALNYDETEIAVLLNRSMTDYISKNSPDLAYCPAPDCCMFFDRTQVVGEKWNCPLCQNDICVGCNVVYHQGSTCEYYQGSKNDPDYSFKVWMSEKNPDCKLCPKCNTAIEKNEGCNHMTCHTCHAHFCWLCRKAFPNADMVYNHQPRCPNRYR